MTKLEIEEFRRTIENASMRLRAVSDEASAEPPAPGKWSPREVIGHLIDSATNNHARFVRAQFVDHLRFDGYDQEAWVTAQDYQTRDWQDLIELWRLYNLHIADVMAKTPDDQLTKIRREHNLDQIAWKTIPADQAVTLAYFMRDYVGHLKNHLKQILEVRG